MIEDAAVTGNALILIGYLSELVRHVVQLCRRGDPGWTKMAVPILIAFTLTVGYGLAILGKLA